MPARVITPEVRTQTFAGDGTDRGWVRIPEWRGDVDDLLRRTTADRSASTLCTVLERHDEQFGVRRLPLFVRGDLTLLRDHKPGPCIDGPARVFSWRTSQWIMLKRGQFLIVSRAQEFEMACRAARRAGTMARDAHWLGNAEGQREFEDRVAAIVEWRGWEPAERTKLIDAHWSVEHERGPKP